MISELLAELLADCGHQVCGVATTESEAVTACAHYLPDLMIVDANLHAGSGVSAMATILRNVAMPHIFMTGGLREGIPAGAIVLQKPFGKAGLIAALARGAPGLRTPG